MQVASLLIRHGLNLIKYWRYGVACLITALICYQIGMLRISWLKTAHESEINEVIDRLQKQCETIQKKNNEASNAYQSRIKDINTRHADAISRLLQHEANKCKGTTASGFDAGASKGLSGEARASIITSLAICDRQAEQLESLQGWLRD